MQREASGGVSRVEFTQLVGVRSRAGGTSGRELTTTRTYLYQPSGSLAIQQRAPVDRAEMNHLAPNPRKRASCLTHHGAQSQRTDRVAPHFNAPQWIGNQHPEVQ